MHYHVVYCFDKNYEDHFGASVLSLILNFREPGESLHIHLITDHADPDFFEKLNQLRRMFRCSIQVISPSAHHTGLIAKLPVNSIALDYMTRATWFRLFIPTLLDKEIDRVIYLDADTIVQESISNLWNEFGWDSPVAGVSDFLEQKLKTHHGLDRYINSGVLLMDLKTWRREQHDAGCLKTAQERADKLLYADQCALNLYFSSRIGVIDPRWNQVVMTEKQTKLLPGGIWHFISQTKPWQRWFDNPLGEMYWHYRRVSPWSNGEPKEAVTVAESTLYARKLLKEGQHQKSQAVYENIVNTLRKHIK